MGREYEEFCGKRVLYLLGRNTDIFSSIEGGVGTDAYLLKLVRADSRIAGRVLRMILSFIIPGLTMIVAAVVLIYLELVLSLLIVCFFIVLTYYQYRVSREAAEHTIRFDNLAPAAGREYKDLLQHCKEQSLQNENRGLVKKMFEKGLVKKQMDAYEGRLRAVENSRLISGIFMAVILGLIMLVMGAGIIRHGEGWGRLLVYVVALRLAMTNLQNSFSTITSINRFYPQVRRYFLFVQSFERQDQAECAPLEEYELSIGKEKDSHILEDSAQSMTVQPGLRLALVTPLELNRYTMANSIRGLLGGDERSFKGALYAARFATSRHSCPNCSLRQVLDLPEDAGWDRVPLPKEMIARLKEHLPGNLNKELRPAVWDRVPPGLKFVLSLASSLRSDAQWLLLEEKGLHLLDEQDRLFFQAALADRIAVIVFNNNHLSRVGAYGEHGVAVMDEDDLIGLGSAQWFLTGARNEIEDRLQAMAGRKGFVNGGADDQDEMDDEM